MKIIPDEDLSNDYAIANYSRVVATYLVRKLISTMGLDFIGLIRGGRGTWTK